MLSATSLGSKKIAFSLIPLYVFIAILAVGQFSDSAGLVLGIVLIVAFYFFYFLTLPFLGIFEKLNMIDSNMFLGEFPSILALFVTATFYSAFLFLMITFFQKK